MEITYTNKSLLSNQDITSFVEFLSGCFGHTDMPVHITFRSKHHTGVSGYAYFPNTAVQKDGIPLMWQNPLVRSKANPAGRYNVTVCIGDGLPRRTFPVLMAYKKRSGIFYTENAAEFIFHTIAHELTHVESFSSVRALYPAAKVSMGEFRKAFKLWQRETNPSGSNEVYAEKVAHGLTAAFRVALENGVQTESQFRDRIAA